MFSFILKQKIFFISLFLAVIGIGVVVFQQMGWLRLQKQIGLTDKWLQTSIQPTPTPFPPQYFVVLGDSGAATPAQFEVAQAIKKSCDHVNGCQAGFLAGDAIYEKSVSSVTDPQFKTKFEEPYKDLTFPMYIAYGNHDYLGCAQCYLDYVQQSQKWRMPSAYYVQNFGDTVSFFVIDTEKFGLEQQQWLKENLAASHAYRKVVIGHRPIETFESTKLGENWQGKAELQEILCRSADLYIAGHAHVLEDNGTIGECPVKQLVSGGGGAYLRTISKKSDGDFGAEKHGFVLLKVNQPELSYSFVDEQGQVLFSSQAATVVKN